MTAMDAIRALVAQHRAIEALFDEVAQETRRRARANAVSRLTEEVIAHLAAEEAVFYPAVRHALDAEGDSSGPCGSEQLLLRSALRRMLETSVGDASFGERIEALHTHFAQHVQDEEAELFPRVLRTVPQAQREALGAEIVASRPPVWIVTTEGGAPIGSSDEWALGSRVCLPPR
jgi:hemerythrin superfamily protein